jgi:hypothetical protein
VFSDEQMPAETMEITRMKACSETVALKDIVLRLRRAKRSLLLSAASSSCPISPVESFRTIVSHLSDVMDDINCTIAPLPEAAGDIETRESIPQS